MQASDDEFEDTNVTLDAQLRESEEASTEVTEGVDAEVSGEFDAVRLEE